MSCHGNPELKTPSTDRLHRESIRFKDFHVAPVCTPTRGQLMTGRDALANGACDPSRGHDMMWPELPTMADIFRDNGYKTGLFGKWHLGDAWPHLPNSRGFDEAIYHLGGAIGVDSDYWNNDYFDDHYLHNGELKQYSGYCTDVWFEEAIKWMEEQHAADDPFFLYIPTNGDHIPLFVPDKYRDPYRHLGIYLASFFGMIANYEENLDKLEQAMIRMVLYENTIVIFMSDNGGTIGCDFYNAGMRGKKGSYYEGGHRVPCFIRWPGGDFTPPRDVQDCTQCQDILPTLISLCGLDAGDASFDGTDLSKLLRGEEDKLSDRMLVVQRSEGGPKKYNGAILWDKWRLVDGKELYDLKSDPGQENDVSARHEDIVAAMKNHYEAWWAKLEPRLYDTVGITVGAPEQEVVVLTSRDRAESRKIWYQEQVRLGETENGIWHINVAREGTYQVSLCRWPREANGTLCSGMPEYVPADTTFMEEHSVEGTVHDSVNAMVTQRYLNLGSTYPEGKALAIKKARLCVCDFDESIDLSGEEKEASFKVELPEGRVELKSWLYDEDGNEIGGAYYVYITRQNPNFQRGGTSHS